MQTARSILSEEKIHAIIGSLLRGGVLLAAVITLIGGIMYLLRYGNAIPDYHVFRGEPADLRGVPGILRDMASFRSRGVIQLGLLMLIATPVARVAFSIVIFALQRDRKYVVITLIVLTALLFSISGGTL
ncbi:MAG TPA: DUF1634 domain-containing protein [Thermodesulfovibrionales bacterium]|nr:DUF1634 domain-containing protein [Thermodesulfovibrionales bacterium]